MILDRVPVFSGEFSKTGTAFFYVMVISFGLAVCLMAAQLFLGVKTITIHWEKLYQSTRIWFLLGIGVIVCGVLGRLSFHTWTSLHTCYAASLIVGGTIIWNTKVIKLASGEDEIPFIAVLGMFVCLTLSMFSMALIVGDEQTLANVSLVCLLWAAVMWSVFLVRRYSGWKKPSTA
ncbi:MAG: hypothetical protein AAB907_02505 [Patescibacteria group bacterium]